MFRLALSVPRLLIFLKPPGVRAGSAALAASAGPPPHVSGGDITFIITHVTIIIIPDVTIIIINDDIRIGGRVHGQSPFLFALEK